MIKLIWMGKNRLERSHKKLSQYSNKHEEIKKQSHGSNEGETTICAVGLLKYSRHCSCGGSGLPSIHFLIFSLIRLEKQDLATQSELSHCLFFIIPA